MSRALPIFSLLLLLPLAGCFSGQQKQLAACEATAASVKSAPGQVFKATQSCMEKAGYRFIGWNDGVLCDMTSLVRGQLSKTGGDVLCFEPSGWVERKLYRLEVPEKAQTSSAS